MSFRLHSGDEDVFRVGQSGDEGDALGEDLGLFRHHVEVRLFRRRDVHLSAAVADRADGGHDGLHVLFLGREVERFGEFGPLCHDQGLALMGDGLPDLLGDKGHEGMHQPEHPVKHEEQDLLGSALAALVFAVETGLGQLDIPVAVVVPDEVIDLLDRHAKLKLIQILCDLAGDAVELGENPAISDFQFLLRGQLVLFHAEVHQHETAGVPELVGKVAHGLAVLHVEAHIVAGAVAGDHVHAQGVGAVAVDHLQRVDAVAQALGHFAALVVADQTVDQNGVEGRLAGMLAGREDHACDPEENDVVAGDQDGGGIEVIEIGGLIGPAQDLKGPESRREPGIQHVGVALDVLRAAFLAALSVLAADRHVTAVGAVPGRDLMAPPELAGDAPVAHVLHPVGIDLGEAVGDELRLALADHAQSLLCKGLHLDEPLGGDDGLHVVVAAVAGADVVGIGLGLFEQAKGLQIRHDGLPRLVAVHAEVAPAVFIDRAVVGNDLDAFQIVAQTDLKVVGVVRGRHLDAAGAEIHLHVVVGHDGDLAVHERKDAGLSHQMRVAFVVRVHGHAGIAHHGLRAGGGHDQPAGAVGQRVAHVPEMARLIHVFDLGVGQGRAAVRAPVDDAAALIDQTLFVEGDEDLADGFGAALVHREAGAVPVAGGAQTLLLLHDAVAVLVLPVPDLLQEFFTTQIVAGQTLLAELLLHLDLRGDSGVIDARNHERGAALHPLVADQDILQSLVHRVPHVKLSGDVWGRHDDGEGLLVRVAFGLEEAVVLPEGIDSMLDLLRIVGFGEFSCHNNHLLSNMKTAPSKLRAANNTVVPPEFPGEPGHSVSVTGEPVPASCVRPDRSEATFSPAVQGLHRPPCL